MSENDDVTDAVTAENQIACLRDHVARLEKVLRQTSSAIAAHNQRVNEQEKQINRALQARHAEIGSLPSRLRSLLKRRRPLASIALERMATPFNLAKTAGAAIGDTTGRNSDAPCILMQVQTLDFGGVEQVVYDLVCGLSALGHRIVTIATDGGGLIADRLIKQGAEVVIFPDYDPKTYLETISALPVVAALTHHAYAGMDQLVARGIPVVEIVHNYYHWNQTDDDYKEKSRDWKEWIAVSSTAAAYHAETYGFSLRDAVVIPNAINVDGLLRPERMMLERARADWKKQFRFINVAQFYPSKSQPLLVSAFAKVRERYPHVHLSLVGKQADPDIKATTDRIVARFGLQGCVDMPDFLSRREVSGRLTKAHAFVQPSIYEGCSIALAEAAYFALPLILTRVGTAADIVKDDDCGILVPASFDSLVGLQAEDIFSRGREPIQPNLQALTDAMMDMVANYEAWGPRGYIAQKRVEDFSLRDMAKSYEKVLTAVTEGKIQVSA